MQKKKVVASIEARMTSSRLPGKVLMEAIDNITMLEFMINRVKQSRLVDDIIVATTINKQDDPIIELCNKLNVQFFRGSEPDVLLRVLDSHKSIGSDIIVELTGDCPLIDYNIVDQVIEFYIEHGFDYVSNAHVRSYPDGLDVQVFSVKLLDEVSKLTDDLYDRENVSTYIYNSGKYKIQEVKAPKELFWPELRITLDDKGDFDLIKNIINHLFPKYGYHFTAKQIIDYIKNNMHILDLLKGVRVTPQNLKTNY